MRVSRSRAWCGAFLMLLGVTLTLLVGRGLYSNPQINQAWSLPIAGFTLGLTALICGLEFVLTRRYLGEAKRWPSFGAVLLVAVICLIWAVCVSVIAGQRYPANSGGGTANGYCSPVLAPAEFQRSGTSNECAELRHRRTILILGSLGGSSLLPLTALLVLRLRAPKLRSS